MEGRFTSVEGGGKPCDEIVLEAHHLKIPDTLPSGKYKLGIILYEEGIGKRNIEIAFKDSIKSDGFYEIAEIDVV